MIGADLATAYFHLPAIDIGRDVVARSIPLQRRSLELAGARHELGAASGAGALVRVRGDWQGPG